MVKTVQLAVDVLELLSKGPALRLSDIAAGLDEPKANVYRVLATLEDRGYVSQLPDERYRLGLRCLELGGAAAELLDLRGVARQHLEKLNHATQENVHLGVYESGDVVYVDKLDSTHPVAPRSRLGTRAPATCVATGRALLAFQRASELDRLLSSPLPRYTDATVTEPDELLALLEQIRADDLARNEGSWREGVCGVAAPVRDHTGMVIASVGVCMPASRFTGPILETIEADVRRTALDISLELGYRRPGG